MNHQAFAPDRLLEVRGFPAAKAKVGNTCEAQPETTLQRLVLLIGLLMHSQAETSNFA
jgi:hypothetical protein